MVSERLREQPHPAVLSWVAGRPRAALHTTSVTQAEVRYGVAPPPAGRRRAALAAAAGAIFAEDFAGRVLPFDGGAADRFGEVVAARRRAGSPIENFDAQIAAIALAAGAALAARGTGGFTGCGLTVLNPWEAA